MSKIEKKFAVATAIGLAGALALGSAQATQNPFAMQDLGKGYQVADHHMKDKDADKAKKKGKDAKCGGDKAKKKGKDAKCGGDKK